MVIAAATSPAPAPSAAAARVIEALTEVGDSSREGRDLPAVFGPVAHLRVSGVACIAGGDRARGHWECIFEASADVVDRGRTCEQAIGDAAQAYGAAAIDERPSYALWQALGHRLEFRCLGEGFWHLQMADPSLAKTYEERLRRELDRAVKETLQIVH